MTKRLLTAASLLLMATAIFAKDHEGITSSSLGAGRFTLIENSKPTSILISADDKKGVIIAAEALQTDFERVCGTKSSLITTLSGIPSSRKTIIAGTLDSPYIQQIVKAGKLDASELKGKVEKYLMTMVSNPVEGVDEALVIAGSDMRGTIYGIYELSEQIGVSPWYDWMDVPVVHQDNLSIANGTYTAGEPAVRYRGIFLNDEAPCLTTWVKNTFGTDFGGHEFYARAFELILRLRGNFMWPAMWGWSFYADDPLNSQTANDMGVIMGTSHHEPMARNHQEWVRKGGKEGEWDYVTNQKVIDQFFREGMQRAKDTEDLITIGMRGDGDTAMGAREGHDDEFVSNDAAIIKILEKVVKNQRKIIAKETGRPAAERQQVWALYKEVQRYYDQGLQVPEDAIILFSDDNWGDIRRLPSKEELKHKGGFGMYYHVDYVGAPRNSKWLNVTPIQHIWDQLTLTYQYGVDKLWVLNVGDLKPMEYPISLFMDMAWDPTRYDAANLLDHTRTFCARQFGEDQAYEAARILNLYSKYAGRVTAEMLDARTYNIYNGEWKQVADEFMRLETEALRQFITLPAEYQDAYRQLILFPVQALGNVYQMYYAQAMNLKLYAEGNPEANIWADRCEEAFRRDAELCRQYNEDIAGGKWNGMMIQKHIGYRSWNDNFPADMLPRLLRYEGNADIDGGYVFGTVAKHEAPAPVRPAGGPQGGPAGFRPGFMQGPPMVNLPDGPSFMQVVQADGYIAMDAEHFYEKKDAAEGSWTIIPDYGRTRSGIAIHPYTAGTDGASISYKVELPAGLSEVNVHVITGTTLAFARKEGHRYTVAFDDNEPVEVNFNGELNEEPENVYRVMYPAAAARVIDMPVKLALGSATTNGASANGQTGDSGSSVHTLTIKPLDPGVILTKIVIDLGGYQESFLFGNESPCGRE